LINAMAFKSHDTNFIGKGIYDVVVVYNKIGPYPNLFL